MPLPDALRRVGLAIAAACTVGTLPGCARQDGVNGPVHESRYSVAFPLQQGGEKLDFLVRVKDIERPYQFTLIFVEPRHWDSDRQRYLRRFYEGYIWGENEIVPYPVRLRIRIDSVGDVPGRPVHIDEEISERSPLYGQHFDDQIWRAQKVYINKFQPGIYRVRVDNLAPAPQLDFETRFLFERDNRRY